VFDRVDEYMRMGTTTVRDVFLSSTKHGVETYEKDWLRKLSSNEAIETEKRFASRGMPGCIGSIDCMKLEWKNYPTALAAQYKGRERKPTIVFEAICDDRLVFNHRFFGMSGMNNDVNVLNASPLLSEIIDGTWPPKVEYAVGGVRHNIPYVLADGIYPPWRVLIQTISQAARASPADHAFSKLQEAIRKDIERDFGVLQSRFSWTKTSCRLWKEVDIGNAFKTCVILHNMMMDYTWKAQESG
jgi:Plant transposon protein